MALTPAAAAANSVCVPRRPKQAGEESPSSRANLRPDIGRKRFSVPGQADQPRARSRRLAAASRPSAVSIVAMIAVAPSSIAFSASRRASFTESCCDAGRPQVLGRITAKGATGMSGVEVAVDLARTRGGSGLTIRAGPSGRCAASARTRAAWTRAASRWIRPNVEIDHDRMRRARRALRELRRVVAQRDEQGAHRIRRTRSPALAGA